MTEQKTPNINDRIVTFLRDIYITDDYGNPMSVGDIVQVHVMPFDYFTEGKLGFDEESCAFYVEGKYGKHTLSHHEEYRDMGATIPVVKTFKRIGRDYRA